MKNIFGKVITVFCLMSLSLSVNACGNTSTLNTAIPQQGFQQTQQQYTVQTNNQEQLLVKFNESVKREGINEFHSKYGTKTLRVLSGINVHVVEIDNTVGLKANHVVEYVKRDPMVKYADVNRNIKVSEPLVTINPVINMNKVNFNKIIGKQIEIKGTYNYSRSGAIIDLGDKRLSILDIDGRVMSSLPNLEQGSKVKLIGLVKEVNGFNITEGIGIVPVSLKLM